MSKVNLDIKRIQRQQLNKYSNFDLPENVLIEIFKSVDYFKDENDIIFNFNIKIGQYIVNQIKNDNINLQINIIDNYSYLKKLIIKNSKYELDKEEINKVYEDAIELLKEKYNENELLSTNIVSNMKYIILSKGNLKEKEDKKEYDVSFLKKYIESYEIDKQAYASAFGFDMNTFEKILNGQKKMNKDDLYLLCSLFGVNTYDEVKKVIEDKIEFHKMKEELLKKRNQLKKHVKEDKKEEFIQVEIKPKKIIEKDNIKKYDLSFIKEYALLYNLTEKDLSDKFHCGVGKVDDILSGKLLIKENLISDIAYEFGAKNYDDMYDKITNKIKVKRDNIKEKTLKNRR